MKKKRRGRKRQLLLFLILITIGSLGYFLFTKVSFTKEFNVDIGGNAKNVFLHNDSIINCFDGKLTSYSKNKKEWEVDLGFKTPVVRYADNIYVAHRRKLAIYNFKGKKTGELETASNIVDIKKFGDNIYIHEGEKISVYDKDNSVISRIDFEKYVLDYKYDENEGELMAITLEFIEDRIKTRLSVYNNDGEEVYGFAVADELMQKVDKTKSNNYVIVSNNNFYELNKNGIVDKVGIYDLSHVYSNGKIFAYIDGNDIFVKNLNNNTNRIVQTKIAYEKIIGDENKVVAYKNNRCRVITAKEEYEKDVPANILNMIYNKHGIFWIHRNGVDYLE